MSTFISNPSKLLRYLATMMSQDPLRMYRLMFGEFDDQLLYFVFGHALSLSICLLSTVVAVVISSDR
jgi:hypothetical protein